MGFFSIFSKKQNCIEEALKKELIEKDKILERKQNEIDNLIEEIDKMNQSPTNFPYSQKKSTDENLRQQLAGKEELIQRKNKEIDSLTNEILKLREANGLESTDSTNILKSRQIDLIEKNIKEKQEENEKLKNMLSAYNLTNAKGNYSYRVDVERFFMSTKYKDVVEYLEQKNIVYIDEITDETFKNVDVKKADEANIFLKKYRNREFIPWDIVTYLNKGDRVNRIYSKNRKLLNIFQDEDIEFMEDLYDYDFNKLASVGFTSSDIEEFQIKKDTYYKERRVSR